MLLFPSGRLYDSRILLENNINRTACYCPEPIPLEKKIMKLTRPNRILIRLLVYFARLHYFNIVCVHSATERGSLYCKIQTDHTE